MPVSLRWFVVGGGGNNQLKIVAASGEIGAHGDFCSGQCGPSSNLGDGCKHVTYNDLLSSASALCGFLHLCFILK